MSEGYFTNPNILSDSEVQECLRAIREGTRAAELMDSDLFCSVVEEIRQEVFQQFWNAPLRDDDGLVKLRMMAKAVDGFTDRIKERVDSGKMAENQLKAHREAGGDG